MPHALSPRVRAGLSLALFWLVLSSARTQDPVLVGFTRLAEHPVRAAVRLPGTVEARVASVVGSEAQGLVVEMNVREGQAVREGEPLAHLRGTTYEIGLRAARGRSKEARARLELARSNLARARELFEGRIISQEELDDAYSEFTAWQGQDDQSTAEVDRFELFVDRCVIRAPYSGVVSRKLTDVGQWIDIGGDVVELVALDDLDVVADVPERYYRLIIPGGEATIRIEALPDVRIPGSVEAIIPSADPQSRTFPVKVRIANRERRIGVGMLAQVSLPLGQSRTALIAPKDAVVRRAGRELVFRIRDDESVESVPVTSGQGVGAWIVVEGPVAAGERVVTRGNERLFPGQAVRGEPLEYGLP